MLKKTLWLAVIALLLVLGCVQTIDPVTGEQATAIAPGAVVAIDTVAEAAPGIAALLVLFFPALIPVSTLLVGAAGTWARMKPKLTTATTEAETYHAATESLVSAIEQHKVDNPEMWAALKVKMGDNVGANTEAVVRAIRGLPYKD